MFGRISPILYILRVLISSLGLSSSRITDGLMVMLIALYFLNSLFSILLTFGHYMDWLCDTLEDLELFKLAKEAWQRRFEASVGGVLRYRFYLLIVKKLTEVKCGAVIYLWSRFLVLLAINIFQQRVEGDCLWVFSVSLALTIDSPIMFLFFIEDIISHLSFYLYKCCHALFYKGGAVTGLGTREGFRGMFLFYVNPIWIVLLHLEMPDRAVALSLLPVFVVAVILKKLMSTSRPVLKSLPASNTKLYRHIAPIILNLCGLLPLVPVKYFLTVGSVIPCTWSLAILANCFLTALEGLVNISVYIIITWDLQQTKENPNTDEFLYHLNLIHQCVQLFYAVAVGTSGLSECILLKHKYWLIGSCCILIITISVYSKVSQCISNYLARRDRIRKLSASLTTATKTQLTNHGDVCSICYLDMDHPEAVITSCSHYFHLTCLKKWVISQHRDSCPFCSSLIPSLSSQE